MEHVDDKLLIKHIDKLVGLSYMYKSEAMDWKGKWKQKEILVIS